MSGAARGFFVLTPVVDYVGIGPIQSVRMRTLHGDTLRDHSISAGAHAPVGVFPSQIHASLHRSSARSRKRLASIQQFVETIAVAGTALRPLGRFISLSAILFTLVGQTIALRGLPPSGSAGRRHKTIVCPTETSLGEQRFMEPNRRFATAVGEWLVARLFWGRS